MPKISVLMPVYNSEIYLREAIDSILNQTFRDFEFIIIDDGSTDSSPDIIRSYSDPRIRFYLNERNMGVAATLNRGLDLATGEYIARMDSDDISLPERFEKQIRYLDRHPSVGICGCSILIFEDGKVGKLCVYAHSNGQICADMIFNSAFAHPSVMLRKSVLDVNDLRYDCNYEKAEDYELWVRILQHSRGVNISEPLLRYRHHSFQVTQTNQLRLTAISNRVREKILAYYLVSLSEAEWNCYLDVCSGARILSDSNYRLFITSGKKIINAFQQGKRYIRKTYSLLNISVILGSRPRKTFYFSWREPIWLIWYGLKGFFHEY